MALTLSELNEWIVRFRHLPGDTLVVLAKDCEGNDFSPLAEADVQMYDADSTWSGQVYPSAEEIAGNDYLSEEDRAPDSAVPCVVLWPTN